MLLLTQSVLAFRLDSRERYISNIKQESSDRLSSKQIIHNQIALANGWLTPYTCQTDDECSWARSSECYNKRCRCRINHRSPDQMTCVMAQCKQDSQCHVWDRNLVCSNQGSCVCKPDYYFSDYDQKCHPLQGNMTWLLFISLFPLVIVTVFLVSCVRLARTNFELKN